MLIACPQCQGRLPLSAESLPPAGEAFLCSHCQHPLFTLVAADTSASNTSTSNSPSSPTTPFIAGLSMQEEAVLAGRVAAREITETPAYNRWHAGVLSTPPVFSRTPARRAWPGLLVIFVLLLTLAGQALYTFRSDLAFRIPVLHPFFAEICAQLTCTIPPLTDSDALLLDATELQADATSAQILRLQTTLKNQAPFAQDWPRLELTLLDANDSVLVRRIFSAAEYLPTALAKQALLHADQSVSIDLPLIVDIPAPEGADRAVATYRLYAFYP